MAWRWGLGTLGRRGMTFPDDRCQGFAAEPVLPLFDPGVGARMPVLAPAQICIPVLRTKQLEAGLPLNESRTQNSVQNLFFAVMAVVFDLPNQFNPTRSPRRFFRRWR